MGFMPQRTISDVLTGVFQHDFILPAIQREFVWNKSQVCRLFDSLMLGYPIGTFLTWKVPQAKVGDYVFYDFVRDYHQRDNPYCPVIKPPTGKPLTAVLDGQQRLTALNIGLRGSHADKAPRLWWNNPHAFPVKRLHLHLLSAKHRDELGLSFDFRFLTNLEAASSDPGDAFWFEVREIMKLPEAYDVMQYLAEHKLGNNPGAVRTLSRLHAVVHTEQTINYYEEESGDLDKVLNIFIRVNSAGTVLSYSDLLLSVASSQWKELDAREAVRGLVTSLNQVGQGFDISKEMVLKAGLVLLDRGDIRFQLKNFDRDTMQQLEANWERLSTKLLLAVRLLHNFGFNRETLAANSVVIPLTYYLAKRELDDSYLSGQQHAADREVVRKWILRSLLKAGVWGSALDQLLIGLRSAVKDHGDGGWPQDEVEAEMARRGKSLAFQAAEIDDLVRQEYGKRAFSVLAMLYPPSDISQSMHVDHVFPKSRFTRSKLQKAGVEEQAISEFLELSQQLCNLQLLPGPVNVQKQAMMPLEWLESMYTDAAQRSMWLTTYDAEGLPASMADFRGFALARRERMRQRLSSYLGVDLSSGENEEAVQPPMEEVDEEVQLLEAGHVNE